jgi:integrase
MIRSRMGAGGRKRWQWRVTIRGFPSRSGTCPTKECARECARKAEAEVRAGRTANRLRLAEVIDAYELAFLPGIPDSASLYRQHLAWWRQELGSYALQAVTPQLISECKLKLAGEVTYRGRLRSAGTVNRYLNTLSSVFTWACSPEVGLADRHPVREVHRLKEPAGRVRWLSRPVDEESSELERLLSACQESKSTILFDLVMLLLSTGCRLNEILHLRRQDIRLEEGGFTIPAPSAKNEEARFVPLEGLGLEIVKTRLATLRHGNDHLFPGAGDKPAWLPKHAWTNARRRAGIRNLRLHDLRHTHGSYLAMMGKTLPEIMQALGHKSPAVALRYTHLADAHKRRVSSDVNAQLAAWVGPTGSARPPQRRPSREESRPAI